MFTNDGASYMQKLLVKITRLVHDFKLIENGDKIAVRLSYEKDSSCPFHNPHDLKAFLHIFLFNKLLTHKKGRYSTSNTNYYN